MRASPSSTRSPPHSSSSRNSSAVLAARIASSALKAWSDFRAARSPYSTAFSPTSPCE